MPSLDDLGSRQILDETPSDADLVPFYDVSEIGNAALKKVRVAQLLAGSTGLVPVRGALLFEDGGSALFKDQISGFWFSFGHPEGTLTAARAISFPDASGTLGVLRAYADSTAANAAVSVGDAWWDTTLKKVRVRLS